ncbi:MAG: cell division protein FtsQ [Tannerella sp.]|nr:cell division protein FtsQ [Tannerella sp.]
MIKKILFILFAVLIVGYLAAVLFFFKDRKGVAGVCKQVEVVITDSLERHFITQKDVIEYLKKTNQYPAGKKSEEINTQLIENALLKNEIIEKAEVTGTISGKIIIVISQKMPILRIFSPSGSYFVDEKGQTMPVVQGQAIYVPVATGAIDKDFATTELYKFALFLQSNDFWNDLTEQIYVRSKNDVEIIPRVGRHRILLGSLDDYEDKLGRLKLFYEQVVPKMGWDKYSVISLKYRNQIVCTKK